MAENMQNPRSKARYWWAVLWLENLRPDWQDVIGDVVQLPYCYCVHDKFSQRELQKEPAKKKHVHLILAWPGPTTYKVALQVFQQLSAPGKKACNTCEQVYDMKHAYDYLLHDTEDCRKKGKYAFDQAERVSGNTFDIDHYVQVSQEDKLDMLYELIAYVMAGGYETINEFTQAAMQDFPKRYRQVIIQYNSTLARYCKGNWMQHSRAR